MAKKLFDLAPGFYLRKFGHDPSGFTRTAYGVDMATHWDDITFRLCVFGGHGRILSDLLAEQSQPFVFLDVGANQGLYTVLAARNANCQLSLAFEPVAHTFELLQKNCGRAGHGDKIRCIQAAVADTAGTADIQLSEGHSGAASMAATRDLGDGPRQTIETVSASEIEAMLPPDVPLIVKVDVEGFEEVVVQELLRLSSAQRIQLVFCEIDLDWINFERIATLLSGIGLTSQSRHGKARHFDLLARRPTP